MAETATEQQNISALSAARKNNEQSPESKSNPPSSSRTVDFSEFLMWETGLTIFWLALAGWIPFWGGVVNAMLIGLIYIWYAANDLNPPSFSPAKATKLAPTLNATSSLSTEIGREMEEGLVKKNPGLIKQNLNLAEKIPGGGTLLFILAVLSGGVGIIPTPMVLFFSIYLANKD